MAVAVHFITFVCSSPPLFKIACSSDVRSLAADSNTAGAMSRTLAGLRRVASVSYDSPMSEYKISPESRVQNLPLLLVLVTFGPNETVTQKTVDKRAEYR